MAHEWKCDIFIGERRTNNWSWPIFTKLMKRWQRKTFINQQLLRIRNLSFHEITSDFVGRKLILKYLQGVNRIHPEALLFFKCHLACDRILRERDPILNESEIIAVLYSLGPSVAWTRIIKSCFSKFEGNTQHEKIILALNELKRESLFEIEIGWERHQLNTELINGTNTIRNLLKNIYHEIYENDTQNKMMIPQ